MSDKPKKEKKEKKPKKEKAPKMKKCPACNEEIPKSAKVCPHCAAKQKQSILPLILAAVLLLVIAACVSIFVFHFPIDPPFSIGGKNISDTVLGTGMELSAKEEAAVQAVLDECGFVKISEVRELSSLDGLTSYAVDDTETIRYLEGEAVVVLDDETKTVKSITCLGKDVYLSGHLITPVTEFYLGSAQRSTYLNASLEAARARLELPETAVFPSKSNWQFSMDGNKVTVRATVTTKDAAGQDRTRPFVVEFEDGSFVSFAFLQSED